MSRRGREGGRRGPGGFLLFASPPPTGSLGTTSSSSSSSNKVIREEFAAQRWNQAKEAGQGLVPGLLTSHPCLYPQTSPPPSTPSNFSHSELRGSLIKNSGQGLRRIAGERLKATGSNTGRRRRRRRQPGGGGGRARAGTQELGQSAGHSIPMTSFGDQSIRAAEAGICRGPSLPPWTAFSLEMRSRSLVSDGRPPPGQECEHHCCQAARGGGGFF